jgi:hypothetical protein
MAIDEDDVKKHIAKQEEINIKLTDAIGSMSKGFSEMSKELKAINEFVHKQEVLEEKINTVDKKIDENNRRAHERMSEIVVDFKEKQENQKKNHIDPMTQSLTYAWRFIFGKMILIILGLVTALYKTIT